MPELKPGSGTRASLKANFSEFPNKPQAGETQWGTAMERANIRSVTRDYAINASTQGNAALVCDAKQRVGRHTSLLHSPEPPMFNFAHRAGSGGAAVERVVAPADCALTNRVFMQQSLIIRPTARTVDDHRVCLQVTVFNNSKQLFGSQNSVFNNPRQLAGVENSIVNNPGQMFGGRNSFFRCPFSGR